MSGDIRGQTRPTRGSAVPRSLCRRDRLEASRWFAEALRTGHRLLGQSRVSTRTTDCRMNLPSAPQVSSKGRALLEELAHPSTASVGRCLELLAADPLAGRVRNADGENAFHLAVGLGHSRDLVIPILHALLGDASAIGVRVRSRQGHLPLHLALAQPLLLHEAVRMLIEAYPAGAAVENESGLIPLFLLCMREDSTEELGELCRLLCRAHPEGPAARNRTGSHPLHFAVRRRQPNHHVLRILLRRCPEAAARKNDFGMFPLQCMAGCTSDVEAMRMVYEAHPEAVRERDPKGRTCLHAAMLLVGERDSELRREEEMEREALLALPAEDSEETTSSFFEQPERGVALLERSGVDRAALRLLIEAFPQALVTPNNFLATPVDTALEKTAPEQRRLRRVSVFGLHDDPASARLLLLKHAHYRRLGVLPPMRPGHARALRELNWEARRVAVLASMMGSELVAKIERQREVKRNKEASAKKKPTGPRSKTPGKPVTDLKPSTIPQSNILARLRQSGGLDCLKLCILWI